MTIDLSIQCGLSIRELELPVFLGWSHDERMSSQTISVDIDIVLSEPPLACETDELNDTLCYSWITEQIKNQMAHRTFHLIEYLAATIYTALKKLLPDSSRIMVKINKKPTIERLKGGVTFSYGDHCIS